MIEPSSNDSQRDEQRLAEFAGELAAQIEATIGGWVTRSIEWHLSHDAQVGRARIEQATSDATEQVGQRVRDLLRLDIDQQTTNPLSVLRWAVKFPTEVLLEAGVAPIVRDGFARENFPDDPYGLTPASFSDVDERLHEPGLVWGAAKAHVHLSRRREAAQSKPTHEDGESIA